MVRSTYSRVAIALHWAIAIAMIAMIPLGLWMTGAIDDPGSQVAAYRGFQLHKSIGLTILALTLVRIVWRLTHRPPPLPAGLTGWEKFAAHAVHAGFYAVLLALPLTGWLYVSTGWSVASDQPLAVATSWFGLVPVPHVPGVAQAAVETRRQLAHGAMGAHEAMAWGAVVLIALHIGAALKHQLIDRDGVLGRMIPFLRQRENAVATAADTRSTTPWLAGVLLLLACGVVGWLVSLPAPSAAPAREEAPPSVFAQANTAIEPGTAQEWAIDYDQSTIGFAGTHAGSPFSGRFEEWEGHVWFDPEDLAGSRASVLVGTASAVTGDATQEGSLADPEWFDTAQYSLARFEADRFEALGDGRFAATGSLTIKGAAVPVVLEFTFAPDGDSARVEGNATLDRADIDMGMASDAGGSWVSRTIAVEISLVATRK